MNQYVCTICGFVYDEAAGIPDAGIAPGTPWDALPADWVCPICGAARSQFKKVEAAPQATHSPSAALDERALGELDAAELAAICSNLGRGCSKQYLQEESALFYQLADYFTARVPAGQDPSPAHILEENAATLNQAFPRAFDAARANQDRGALRALTWAEKVARIQNSILERYVKEGDAMLEHTSIYVCEICGFIYVGDNPPELCPVCKVPGRKLHKVERR